MKKITLIRSLRDLAALKAKKLCSEDKPYFKQFLDVYEKKIQDDLIQEAIDNENLSLVSPVIEQFAKNHTDIPVPFDYCGGIVNQIRIDPDSTYYSRLEVSLNGENWHYLGNDDKLRLFDALDQAGCLDYDE